MSTKAQTNLLGRFVILDLHAWGNHPSEDRLTALRETARNTAHAHLPEYLDQRGEIVSVKSDEGFGVLMPDGKIITVPDIFFRVLPDEPRPAPACKWSYQIMTMDGTTKIHADALAKAGGEGWELVTIMPPKSNKSHAVAYFKRPAR